MKARSFIVLNLIGALPALGWQPARADEAGNQSSKRAAESTRVYGEWLIRPRPEKGAQYTRLIGEQGLALFREGGGRMIGWWNTLVGNLYEQVTIWEYDDLAAYQNAVDRLGKSDRFARFVSLRDPLLAAEQSRFLQLAAFAEQPRLPETAPSVIHETHRVPLRHREAYLRFMKEEGLPLLKKRGFRPVGPWSVAIGKWTEITYLFLFESLAQYDRLLAAFRAHPDGKAYGKVNELAEEISTRLLVPTPLAVPRGGPEPSDRSSSLLPHLEQLSAGVFAAGFSARSDSANCGWLTEQGETLLVDLPREVAIPAFIAEVTRVAGTPPRTLLLTHFESGDAAVVEALLNYGVTRVLSSAAICNRLRAASNKIAAGQVQALSTKAWVVKGTVQLLSLDGIVGGGGAAVYLPARQILFAGPFVVNGPGARLAGTDTALWIAALEKLEACRAGHVVPGFGSWGDSSILDRQKRFLAELRRQVGHAIAQGRSVAAVRNEVHLATAFLTCTPYDQPTGEDVEHVYRELTVPAAPFNGRLPPATGFPSQALVLIGDGPHEPGHIEEGLQPVFAATGLVAHFAVDVRALSAENLARVQLLVILRDGLQRPEPGRPSYIWMTPEQEQAVVRFVKQGGAVLNLHNALGLYPAGGAYLRLMGGQYTGHGPLERFRVEVVDSSHPITEGIEPFTVLDEQHAPLYDAGKVHLLLRSRSDAGNVTTAGWAYEPGRGRVCHLAPGHTREALLHPVYQRLLRNAVRWCLGQHTTSTRPAPGTRRVDGPSKRTG
jgi:type 1 glutamine amidotransferase